VNVLTNETLDEYETRRSLDKDPNRKPERGETMKGDAMSARPAVTGWRSQKSRSEHGQRSGATANGAD